MEIRMISREDYYVPDIPKDEPVAVRHISLTAEQARNQGWHYKRKSNGRLRITRYTGNAVDIIIPAEIGGYVVNEVGERVFFERVMNSIEFPDTVKKIGERCCQQSTVSSITVAGDVTVIPHAFALSCRSLECVRLADNVQRIGEYAFGTCEALTHITIPKHCKMIGERAFNYSSLSGFAYRAGTGSALNAHYTAFFSTPLAEKYLLILKSDPANSGSFDLLVQTFKWEQTEQICLKFPAVRFSFGGDSVRSYERNSWLLDLSACTAVSASFDKFSPPPRYSWPEKRRHNTVIVPNGTRGAFFPPYVDARYASGRIYDGYLPVETQSEELTVVSLQGDILPSFSLMHETKKLIIRNGVCNAPVYQRFAVYSKELQHIVFDSLAGGEGQLFSDRCTNLHCVEWGTNKVYLPMELIEWIWHGDLLEAFTCKNGKDIFDSSQFAQVFNWRFQNQRTKIVLAADVMRSTPTLFPDREMYRKYLDNHMKYALILCDELPEDYSAFLRAYFGG